MKISLPWLSIIIWLPIIAGILLLFLQKMKAIANITRFLPLITAIVTLLPIYYVLQNFTLGTGNMQFTELHNWLPTLGIQYALGVDGFAILLVALTVFMTLLVVIAGFNQVKKDIYLQYCANFLIMQGLMCGVFLALDAILFYVFFEAMMIPMFLLIGLWGSANRIYATFKFILYTLFGSLFLLVALLYLNHVAVHVAGLSQLESFRIANLQGLPLELTAQKWLFAAMLLAFAIKIPMWPVHTWLPDAHVEAPTGGSMILAAIMLKMGGYGILRFLLPMLPAACDFYANFVIALSLVAIVYIGLVSIVQKDLKKLIAYSSIAHMGFVTLGLFLTCKIVIHSDYKNSALGIDGAVLQMLSHGFISAALFFCVGILYVRLHTRQISDYGGVVNTMPIFASFLMLFALANVGMPGTFGFVGEFFIILLSFKISFWVALLAGLSLILGVAYTLWMYKRVVFGTVANDAVAGLQDLAINEKIVCMLLAGAILLFGIWPNPLLNILRGSSQQLISQLHKSTVGQVKL